MAIGWKELQEQLLLGAQRKKEFIAASFELTSRCNLQCKMCYVSRPANDKQAKAKELTAAEWIRIAEEARDAGLLILALTGGEVFLREDFKEIYEKLMKLGFIIQILTNGTLLTPDLINWLSTMPPANVHITLYGASRETYHKVTGYAEGFDKTIKAIDTLLAKGIRTEIRTTVIQGNKHEYDKLLDIAMQRKLRLGIVNYVSTSRECSHSDPVANRLSPLELHEYEVHIAERDKQLASGENYDLSKITDAVAEDIIPLRPDNESKTLAPAFTCRAGSCAGWITWDGKLLPCGLLDMPATNPLEKGFLMAWEELKHKCNLIPVCKECQECQYQYSCEHCPARLYRETGSYDKPAPYLCEMARIRMEHKNRQTT